MQIYLIRHPRPQNDSGTCYGRRDVRVSAEQIAAAALALHTQEPVATLRRAPIYTSPLYL